MKRAQYGDIHIYKHLSKSIFEDIALKFLYDFTDEMVAQGISVVDFLGDFFHIKSKLYVPTFIRAQEALDYMKAKGLQQTFLIGNHDMPFLDTTDFSIMHSFKPYGRVIPDYEWEDVGDTRIHHLSYTHVLPAFKMGKHKNVLLTHLDIKGFSMDGQIAQEGFDRKVFHKFDLVISGHFHKHQFMDNILYVGSPYQTRYSERFDDKGYVIWDTEDLSWEFKTYSKSPVFQEVNLTALDDKSVVGNFIRIKTTPNATDLPKIKERLLAAGAHSVDFIYESSQAAGTLEVVESLSMGSNEKLAEQYIDAMIEQGLLDKSVLDLIEDGTLTKEELIAEFGDIKEAFLTGWKPLDDEVA
jgi:predicted phosphodiesterase